jgi:hypothetical protein
MVGWGCTHQTVGHVPGVSQPAPTGLALRDPGTACGGNGHKYDRWGKAHLNIQMFLLTAEG